MRIGICVIIGAPCADSSSMVSETFPAEIAQSACPKGLRDEHEAKKRLLRGLDIGFMELQPPDGAANFIYTRDQLIVSRAGRVLFCNMRRPERRPEVAVFKRKFGVKDCEIVVPEAACLAEIGGPDAFLEGGDSMQFGNPGAPRAVLFRSRRSSPSGIEVVSTFFKHEGYAVDVLETSELHGTSGISVIGPETMLVNPAMVDLKAVERLRVKVLLVPERERHTLAGNAAYYGAEHTVSRRDVVVCNSDHPETAAMLVDAGYQVELLKFTHHHRGEGNTDCAMGQRIAINYG